jgi:transcriptional regulator
MTTTIQERILQYLEYKKVTPYKFCKDLEFPMGSLNKRGSIGTDKYLKIIKYYRDLNPEWLLSGEGSMLKKEQKTQANTPDDKYLLLLEEHNKTLKDQLKDKEAIIKEKEEKEALYKEKIKDLQQQVQANTIYQSGAPTASYSLSTPPAP